MYSTNPYIFMYPRVTGHDQEQETQFVLFNPDNRRRFEIPSGIGLPRIISLILSCSEAPRSEKELIELNLIMSADELASMAEAGILVTEKIKADHFDFLLLYQRLVHNYPFGDYDIPQTIDEENSLMDKYAKSYEPPSSYFERPGTSYALPDVSEHNKQSKDFSEDLAKILHYTFGSFGLLKGRHGKFFHKTSPSGGSRHPSEAIVVLNIGLNDIPAGVYSYDFLKKSLIDSESVEMKERITEQFKHCKVAIIVRSCVERPMWRYRDPRSYRPVIIDAGHIVETAKLLVEDFGYNSCVSSPCFIADSKGDWLKEPFLTAIAIDPNDQYDPASVIPLFDQETPEANDNYVINPASFYTVAKGKLLAHTLLPRIQEEFVPEGDLESIFLPSEKYSQFERSKFLRENNIVISKSFARPLLEGFSLWGNHDWDLSLLAYLAVSNNQSQANGSIIKNDKKSSDQPTLKISENLIDVMLRRHTDRRLTGEGVDRKTLQTLLSCAINDDLLGNDIDTFAISFSVNDLDGGVYQWSDSKQDLIKKTELPDRANLRAATIGQTWASHGSTSLIFSYSVSADSPAAYNAALVRLGMLGQRICIKATSLGLGTFMTPALNDKDIAKILGIGDNYENRIFYLIDVGTSHMSLRGKIASGTET